MRTLPLRRGENPPGDFMLASAFKSRLPHGAVSDMPDKRRHRASPPSEPVADPQRLRVPQAATYLGVSERYVRRLVAERRVPFTKLGALVLFDRADLDALLERNRVEATR